MLSRIAMWFTCVTTAEDGVNQPNFPDQLSRANVTSLRHQSELTAAN
jgi:hypothetical protein